MIGYAVKKTAWNLGLCLAVWAIVYSFSPQSRLYAGFAAAALGASYLLAAWLAYLKSAGTDVLGRFRRTPPPSVPYFHRDKSAKPGIRPWTVTHSFDDDLAETTEDNDEAEDIPPPARHKVDAAAYAVTGFLLLALSLWR